jgi:hypothetical protein
MKEEGVQRADDNSRNSSCNGASWVGVIDIASDDSDRAGHNKVRGALKDSFIGETLSLKCCLLHGILLSHRNGSSKHTTAPGPISARTGCLTMDRAPMGPVVLLGLPARHS